MNKIVIVGCGNVGITYAYSLINNNFKIDEIVLIDINQDRLTGACLDLQHAVSNSGNNLLIKMGDYKDCADATIVCITAGPSQNNIKQSRLDDLYKANEIIKSIVPKIKESGFSGIYLLASNPLDVMTYMTWKYADTDFRKVIGSGTLLDSARLKYLLSETYQLNLSNIQSYVVGEHGDSQLIKWDLNELKHVGEKKLEIAEKVRKFGYEIASRQGFTCYGVASALSRITKAILEDEQLIIVASTYLEKEDVFISTPSRIGRAGVLESRIIEFTEEEAVKFENSVNVIKNAIKEIM